MALSKNTAAIAHALQAAKAEYGLLYTLRTAINRLIKDGARFDTGKKTGLRKEYVVTTPQLVIDKIKSEINRLFGVTKNIMFFQEVESGELTVSLANVGKKGNSPNAYRRIRATLVRNKAALRATMIVEGLLLEALKKIETDLGLRGLHNNRNLDKVLHTMRDLVTSEITLVENEITQLEGVGGLEEAA